MIYTKYHPTTGQITTNITISDTASLATNLPDNNYIAGHVDGNTHYIDIDAKMAIEKPAKPSDHHVWDATSKSWQLDIDALSYNLRSQRYNLLTQIDRVNPIWYNSLTEQQQIELQQYRTDLLNVPQQSGFPTNITWPSKPAWL